MYMKKAPFLVAFILTGLFGNAQMKSLKELTDTSDTGWEVIRQLPCRGVSRHGIKESRYPVRGIKPIFTWWQMMCWAVFLPLTGEE